MPHPTPAWYSYTCRDVLYSTATYPTPECREPSPPAPGGAPHRHAPAVVCAPAPPRPSLRSFYSLSAAMSSLMAGPIVEVTYAEDHSLPLQPAGRFFSMVA